MATTLLPEAAVFGDVRAVSYLSVVQDLRAIAGDRSFIRRRLSPVAKASAKELSASAVECRSVQTPAVRSFRKYVK